MTEPVRGVAPTRNGGVTVNLSVRERDLLRTLPDQLRPLVAGDETAPSVAPRLYSRGYDDDGLNAEYQELVHDDVVRQRTAALDTFAATLDQGGVTRGRWRVELDAEQAAAWLSAVNDGRLVLGALLDITDESAWEDGPDEDNPASVVMYYLGWLQEELVGALMAALPDE